MVHQGKLNAKAAGESVSSLSVRVFEQLEEAILNGKILPGENLIELKLSQELGVSRTPVREAIRMLEQKSLVQIIPNKGAVVLGIDYKDLLDIYTIRTYIEGLAARWAAENITDLQIKELREIIDLQEFYYIKDYSQQINDLDSRFHERIYEYCNSRTLQHMLKDLHHMIQHFRQISISAAGRAEKAIGEHRAILEAICNKDPVQAERLTVDHINNAKENLIRLLEGKGENSVSGRQPDEK
ncbi:MAG: GntR family transcriptional regulator [Peptococcaceae bacterium]|nr:GntR family transcriptional regulator [Peptococcaceae bacterium]